MNMNNFKKLLCLVLSCIFYSCTDISGLESDINNINDRVSSLENALAILNKAYSDNKLISTVVPTKSGDGWVITFNDNQSLTVVNGANNPTLIKSIVQNKEAGTVTITMQDGSVFCFGLSMTTPTSISVLAKKVYLNKSGECSFPIVINPSNARINSDENNNDVPLLLNLVNKTRATYISSPTNYKIKKIKGVDSEGVYEVTIADLAKCANYVEDVTLVVRVDNNMEEEVLISSNILTIEWRNGEDFYDFKIGDRVGMFDGTNIIVELPSGTKVTSLSPTFKTNGNVTVAGIPQISGLSTLDFSKSQEYSVTAADGTVTKYKVSIVLK